MIYVLEIKRELTEFADWLDMEFESKKNSGMNARFWS